MEPELPGAAFFCLEPPFFAWSRSRLNLVGAGVGFGTPGFRSRRRSKKWRLCNTAHNTCDCRGASILFCW